MTGIKKNFFWKIAQFLFMLTYSAGDSGLLLLVDFIVF